MKDEFQKIFEITKNFTNNKLKTKKELADIENKLKEKHTKLVDSLILNDGQYTDMKKEINGLTKKRDELIKQKNLLDETRLHKRPFMFKAKENARNEVVKKIDEKQREIADKVHEKLYPLYDEVIMLQKEIENDNLDCQDIARNVNQIIKQWPKPERDLIKRVRYDFRSFEEYKISLIDKVDDEILRKKKTDEKKWEKTKNIKQKILKQYGPTPIQKQVKLDKEQSKKIEDAKNQLKENAKKREMALAKKGRHLKDKEEKKEV